MRISVLADEAAKKELLEKGAPASVSLLWKTDIESLVKEEADAYLDLLFHNNPSRIAALSTLLPAPVFINAVTNTLSEIGMPFIRINAWPGFLKRPLTEIAVKAGDAAAADRIMKALDWNYRIVPDEPGMIAPRVLAMIINEAYFALAEGVSTKSEIDTAMKWGTNYPLGPFEWGEKIGLDRIGDLLDKLSRQDERYRKAFR